eukprot:12931669-Alexandrium_andersonii.AAC.1
MALLRDQQDVVAPEDPRPVGVDALPRQPIARKVIGANRGRQGGSTGTAAGGATAAGCTAAGPA